MVLDGPAFSMGDDRRKGKQVIDRREIGNQWTYFGYDDFGHTEHADIRRRDKLPSFTTDHDLLGFLDRMHAISMLQGARSPFFHADVQQCNVHSHSL
jgi:hypothetical protein